MCEYCDGSTWLENDSESELFLKTGGLAIAILPDGYLLTEWWDYENSTDINGRTPLQFASENHCVTDVKLNFCPMCGRQLQT